MCYSAQIKAVFGKYVRLFGAELNIRAESQIKVPKALEAEFALFKELATRIGRAHKSSSTLSP